MDSHEQPLSRWISVGLVSLAAAVGIAIFIPYVEHAREEARKASSRSNLKQIGIAIHNYHDTYGTLPPGSTNADETKAHGWQAVLIPYMEANPYYEMIDFGHAWDDPANAPISRLDISGYKIPGATAEQTTDGFGLTHYAANARAVGAAEGKRLTDFGGGLHQVVLVGELAGDYAPWASPYNHRSVGMTLNTDGATFGRPTEDGAILLFAGGDVDFVTNEGFPARIGDVSENQAAPNVNVPTFEYATTNWSRTHAGVEGLRVSLTEDGAGVEHTVVMTQLEKDGSIVAGVRQIDEIVEKWPRLRTLHGPIRLDDDVAASLAGLEDLEALVVRDVALSDAGLARLAKLERLTLVVARSAQHSLSELEAALPDCEIRLRSE